MFLKKKIYDEFTRSIMQVTYTSDQSSEYGIDKATSTQ